MLAGLVAVTAVQLVFQVPKAVAAVKKSSVRDITVCILDRPRHQKLMAEVREAGARIRLISDGDVAGAIAAARPDSGTDLLVGIGGTPEGIIAAAAGDAVHADAVEDLDSRPGPGHNDHQRTEDPS